MTWPKEVSEAGKSGHLRFHFPRNIFLVVGARRHGLILQGKLKMRPMVLPDTFIEAGTQTEQYEEAGLSAGHIRASVLRLFDQTPVPTLSASKAPASKQ